MSALDVPNSVGLSTSLGTPQLTINHDVAADLDSSSAFEGPEKLLEVWFAPNPDALPSGAQPDGLKAVPEHIWTPVLDLVNCKVLSVVRHPDVDAYLLSESSMFVFPHKLILKTCGTTTLLLGLHALLNVAAVHAGFPFHNASSIEDVHAAATPHRVFYSRKRFLFPDKQHGPHRSWNDEVKYLDNTFERGSAYLVGKMNGDHWYLYITSPLAETITPPRTPDSEQGSRERSAIPTSKIPTGLVSSAVVNGLGGTVMEKPDETLEILMTDLDQDNAQQFYLSNASAAAQGSAFAADTQSARKDAHENLGDMSEGVFAIDDCGNDASGDQAVPASDQLVTEALTTEGHALGTVVSDTCGLSQVYPTSVYPDAKIDAYLFQPCGFSANGVVPAPDARESPTEQEDQAEADPPSAAHYFTVHVTPEPQCSFASFETNVPGGQSGRETADIIENVVNIFRPGRFSVTLFENKGTNSGNPYGRSHGMTRKERSIAGYRRIDRIYHDFEDYDLVFRYYEKEGYVGGGARLGEDY